MPRQMTAAEKQRFHGYFPSLDVNNAVVTGEFSPVYNCLSWTVGVTDRWLWPGPSIANFDSLYRGFGFVRAGDGTIAAWGISLANMTHGCVSGPGHGPRWESKCGRDLRIQHGLNELVSSSYGRVLAFYRRNHLLEDVYSKVIVATRAKRAKTYLSAAQKKALAAERKTIAPELQKAFAEAFSAWKKTWYSGSLAVSSDPRTRTIGREFDALIALGPVILPLVIDEIANPENFLALQLYDALQSDDTLIVQFEAEDERILEGEQGRAQRVVQAWFTNR